MGKLIAIDAGHGLETTYKCCSKEFDPNKTLEWVLNARVAGYVTEYLERAGHTVIRTDDVTGKTNPSLASRYTKANNNNCSAFVSIHHNMGINGGKGGGTSVFCRTTNPLPKSIELRDAIYDGAIKYGNLRGNRSNPKTTANFTVIYGTKMPAMLIECGFMDSSTDCPIIINPEWSKKVARGIAEGICKVVGGTVTESSATPVAPTTQTTTNTTNYKTGVYKITASALNVRAGAGTDFAILGSLANGKTAEVTAINGKWGKIDFNGKVGYISLAYAERTGDLPTPKLATTSTTTASALIKKGQEEAKKFTGKTTVNGKTFAIDGDRGAQTRTMAAMVLQTGLNKAFNAGLAVDGAFGTKSKTALAGKSIKRGDKNYLVTAAEILLYMLGKDPNGVEYPGSFGGGLTKACGAEKIDANMLLSYLN